MKTYACIYYASKMLAALTVATLLPVFLPVPHSNNGAASACEGPVALAAAAAAAVNILNSFFHTLYLADGLGRDRARVQERERETRREMLSHRRWYCVCVCVCVCVFYRYQHCA